MAEVTDFTGQYVKVCVSVTEKGVGFITLLSLSSFLLNSFVSGFFFQEVGLVLFQHIKPEKDRY